MTEEIKEQIEYRKVIMEKVYAGKKITKEERLWLVTHSVYNHLFGYPFLKMDVIKLNANQLYVIKLQVEKKKHNDNASMIIGAAGGNGKVITDWELINFYGENVNRKDTEILQVTVDSDVSEYTVTFISGLGLLCVEYGCEYYDEKMKVKKMETSFSGSARFSMTKEIVSDNKVRYSCKDPVSDSYEALVFTVEWTLAE